MTVPKRYEDLVDPDNDPVSAEAEKRFCPINRMRERVELVREERNMNRANFAKSIGLSPQGYQSMISSDRITEPVAMAIEYKHGFSKDWIQYGREPQRIDLWEMVRGEVEDSFLRDLRIFINQKLKRTQPMVLGKDKNEREYDY